MGGQGGHLFLRRVVTSPFLGKILRGGEDEMTAEVEQSILG